jgi:shikimate kinase
MVKVVLTGFMGTGKTAVGERLATRLGGVFVDTDVLVERAEGRSVEQIFALHGEAYFRAAERRAVAEALAVPNAIVATGGGAIVDAENFRRLHAAAPIVCLTASAAVIFERTRHTPRPLLAGPDPLARIRELMARRAVAYARADLTIDTSTLEVDAVADHIVAQLPTVRRSGRVRDEHIH